jgi:riboflavin kinase
VASLGGAERATRDVLKEFLGTYGKVPDAAKEVQRLGQMHRESTTGIIADYGLPLTVEQYSEAIYPLYMKRFGSFFREPTKSAAVLHHDSTWISLFFRWQSANPLPGVKRLLKHLHKNGVPLALASNSIRRNIHHKILKLGGLNFYLQSTMSLFCSKKLGQLDLSYSYASPDFYFLSEGCSCCHTV